MVSHPLRVASSWAPCFSSGRSSPRPQVSQAAQRLEYGEPGPSRGWRHDDRMNRDEVASLVTSEIASLPEDQLAALFPFVVALEPFATDDGPGSDGRSYWLIARDGDRV